MHSKEKGNIGETAVALDLMRKGYAVFTELGDNSRIDLIAVSGGRLIRIQVKYITPLNGAVKLRLKKSAKGYSFSYGEFDFDYFAVYSPDFEQILYVPMSRFFHNGENTAREISIRLAEPKNNQSDGIHLAKDFLLI